MKKHLKWLIPVLVLVAAIGGWKWYTRPMTLEQLFPDLGWEQARNLTGYCLPGSGADAVLSDTVAANDPQTQALIQSLRGITVRREITAPWSIGQREYPPLDNGPLYVGLHLFGKGRILGLTLYQDVLLLQHQNSVGKTRWTVCTLTDQSPDWHAWVDFIDAHPRQ